MNVTYLEVNTIPTLGNILGTQVDSFIIDRINSAIQNTSSMINSTISNIVEEGRKQFVKNIVEPIKKTVGIFKKINLDDVNKIKPITCEDDLINVPPAMYLPIILYQPIRELLEQGRIDGWGFNPEWLPEEDYYGRLISNGVVENIMSNLKEEKDKDGNVRHYIEFNYEFTSEDPDLEFDELDYIEQTRKFLDELLENSRIDPTNPTRLRG